MRHHAAPHHSTHHPTARHTLLLHSSRLLGAGGHTAHGADRYGCREYQSAAFHSKSPSSLPRLVNNEPARNIRALWNFSYASARCCIAPLCVGSRICPAAHSI